MINQEKIIEILTIYNHKLSEEAIEKLALNFELKEFNKGDVLVSNRGVCETCYLIYSGFTHAYYFNGESNQTLWFGEKGDFVTSFQSLFNQTQGNEIVETLTECTVLAIDMKIFKSLIKSDLEIANFYIKILESGYKYWERRFIIYSQHDAASRYQEWKNKSDHVTQYISLGVLAKYLNINQATLSRIRAKENKKEE